MEQRTSVMLSAIVFAAVVAGAVAYLIYTRPVGEPPVATSPTPPPAGGVVPVGEIVIATPEPTPQFAAVEIREPEPIPQVASAVAPSAPTGAADITLLATLASVIAGAFGIRRLAA